jgi:ATP-dependent DNA helicase RecQ
VPNLETFLAQTAAIDLEVNEAGDVYAIGALLGEARFSRKGRLNSVRALRELDEFCAPAQRVLGHNILRHDLPLLRAKVSDLGLFRKPAIDTLYLSPLAFPEHPYHRLVKDYKLVRDSLNDPLADARLALSLFRDQWERFAVLQQTQPDRLAFIRYCLESDRMGSGLGAFFAALGTEQVGAARAFAIFRDQLSGEVCASRFPEVVMRYLPDREQRIALAYCVAWLGVAGGNSVLPPWVRLQFDSVAPILTQLRDRPCGDPACDYCRRTHHPETQLKRYFGFDAFRPKPADADGGSLQRRIVAEAMADRSLLAILPTGGGKSLCYQLPALTRYQRRGLLTIVISPLQALMKDQVDNLRNKTGAPNAAALYGLLTPPERGEVLEGVRMGDTALLYVAPEQLRNRSFNEAIRYREIGCWVFDEAHCLSKWGHDFRPDYLYAGRRIKEIAREQKSPMPAVQCFTATAKADVKAEILDYFQRELGLELAAYGEETQRDNLRFEVQMVNRAEKFGRVLGLLEERLGGAGKGASDYSQTPNKTSPPPSGEGQGGGAGNGSVPVDTSSPVQDPPPSPLPVGGGDGAAVIYCATRKATEELAEFLIEQGWSAAAFHANLEPPLKRSIQEEFIAGNLRVICATNAFGMGIDKEDVRLVIHADIPGSLENYIQEAGRAGRDNQDAECVLLYDEQDIETQFKLGSLSELSRRDIAQILRGLRSARRNEAGEVVLTTGELLRSDQVEASFDTEDRQADTKVRAAVAWLERAGFIQRDQNHTQVFQGRPQVANLEEAERRIDGLDLSKRQKQRWLAILGVLMEADSDEGFSADELAEIAAFRPTEEEQSSEETAAQRVLRTLHDMAEQGLIKKSMQLTAFVRHGVKDYSEQRLQRVAELERALIEQLREAAPDADQQPDDPQWQELSLRRLNQHLLDEGFQCLPEQLRNLLHSLSLDGRGLAASKPSLELRHLAQDRYAVRLRRDWRSLHLTSERRTQVAMLALRGILEKIPPNTKPSAELLVEFSAEEIVDSLKADMLLGPEIRDPLAALDRALMFLHEQRVIILQQGLAVFRSAMTIRILPEQKGRRYTNSDFEPLANHYTERVFQVHVMNEYALRGLEKIGQAIGLAVAYFQLDKEAFVRRYFPNRREVLERATGQVSYQKIVEDLNNPVQQALVAADPERNLLILAGPGAGKTRVVVHRCAWLLRVKREPPRSILILCFNRNAAAELRRRLFELAGDDARGVTVQTYHGLALRLTGQALADHAGDQPPDFDAMLSQAIELLEGHAEVPGLEADELRDRLIAGYRHILVDEYQDIDDRQYRLISAIAGRTLADPDRKLSILAVGDDDQNIYQFRGTNVGFIRRFEQDYQVEPRYLVENYRSSAHIIAAANQLIAANRDRMKADHPIRINKGRADLDPGGRWQRLDPLAQGRVQRLRVKDQWHQARALVDELRRLEQLDPAFDRANCAILARRWEDLDPLRALLEAEGIPVSRVADARYRPPPFALRENRQLLDRLRERRGESVSAAQLIGWVMDDVVNVGWGEERTPTSDASDDAERWGSQAHPNLPDAPPNPWHAQLLRLIEQWREEAGDTPQPVARFEEFLCEALAEQRQEQRLGEGIFLSTVHAAKGMEFDHLFLLDGGWQASDPKDREAECRLYYVALSRARQTLCILRRAECLNPFADSLEGEFLIERDAPDDNPYPSELKGLKYDLIGLSDLYLSYAGHKSPKDPIHPALAELQPGTTLRVTQYGGQIRLLADSNIPVAQLAKGKNLGQEASGQCKWQNRLAGIEELWVFAVIRREKRLEGEEYQDQCRVDWWELPLVEVSYREPDGEVLL